jgi:PAS domain S-box-containing protein
MTETPGGGAELVSSPRRPASSQPQRAEDHLKTETGFISAVLDTVGALIIVLDRDGRIVLFNQACVRSTGYTIEEVEGRCFWDMLLLPAELEPVKKVFSELAAGHFPNKHVNYWVAKNGDRRLISWSNTAVVEDGGDVEFVIGTGIDITEHTMLERQLHQAQKMEAVGRLAGGVAHDFGSVLTAINGYIERARKHLDEDSPGRKDLQGAIKACERGTDLIRQLLVISRPREIEPDLLDLNDVVDDTSAMLRRVVGDDVQVALGLRAKRGRALSDRSQIEQVLLNLAVNAREAMPHGGVLSIETADVDLDERTARTHGNVTPGSYTMLGIKDNGSGMDRETLSHIFEPFFTTKEEGTGLGLSTVYGILKGWGGHVLVDSEPKRGTHFRVYLPRAG